MNKITLKGCSPTPLANYLKALGVLRIVAEQLRVTAPKGAWQDETFTLSVGCTRAELTNFFLNSYQPSAVVAPWNGGSGFHPKDNKKAINAIRQSETPRLALFRKTIATASAALNELGIKEKPDSGMKESLLRLCRNRFPDESLGWLDAAFFLTKDGDRYRAKYPPLLGTGGNDGRLDFTNNYMQRLSDVFDSTTGEPLPDSASLLDNSLFGDVVTGLADNAVGQFGPAASGGANATSGFSSKACVNPWDFIFMLEGAILFAASSVKRLGSSASGQLSYPFSVRTTGAGYGSASEQDETDSRCEMWMPLWSALSSFIEIQRLFSEGRVQIGLRPARDGLDFYRAIADLGIDRGIDAFQRYAFLKRKGDAHFATPLDRVQVRTRNKTTDLLSDLDQYGWLDRIRRQAAGANAPSSVMRSVRQLDRSIINLCTASQDAPFAALEVRELIIALGRCEQALGRSLPWTEENNIHPVPPLSASWLLAGSQATGFGALEYRLAAALASLRFPYDQKSKGSQNTHSLRSHISPVSSELGNYSWLKADSRDVIGLNGDLADVLNSILHRRILICSERGEWKESSSAPASLSDITMFIENRYDETLLKDLIAGLSLINWSDKKIKEFPRRSKQEDLIPSILYGLLKLCHCHTSIQAGNSPIKLNPAIHRMAASDQPDRAAKLAIDRLRASGHPLRNGNLSGFLGTSKRVAAAILFNLWSDEQEALSQLIHSDKIKSPESKHNQTEENILEL